MDIRPLVPEDVDQYLAIWQRALTDTPSAFGASANDPDMFDREAARQRIANSMPYNPIFGVFSDGQQVALSSVFYQPNREKVRHRLTVHQVFVAPEMRGQGIAKAMMQALITFAKTLPEVEEVHLAVTVGNEAARQLYVDLGFVSVSLDERALKIDGRYYHLERMVLRF